MENYKENAKTAVVKYMNACREEKDKVVSITDVFIDNLEETADGYKYFIRTWLVPGALFRVGQQAGKTIVEVYERVDAYLEKRNKKEV